LLDLSALRSKWCVPGIVVADHSQDQDRSGGGRGWTRWRFSACSRVLFACLQGPFVIFLFLWASL
jgi:hypothetical protein